MASEKMIDKIKRISSVQDNIRNICTSAHIHHGKTAFTDNLLAAAGLMSEKNAGDLDDGMATWQHSDEQERLMTVDAANVSMVHEFHGKEYLINLIDTPGHIDFGGNVTRAMRAIDGTIVLVCASEGIMPQTETVLKQAVRERVKPILFINKVDRLIKEMQYTPEQMQARFVSIISQFNKLVSELAEKQFGEKWQANIQDGSVMFGSARDNWALSLPYMQKKGVNFKDIIKLYEMSEAERKEWVWKYAPVHEVVLDMVIKHLPTPGEAQVYRIPKIWKGEMDSELGKDLLSCNPKGKLAFCVTRVMIDLKSQREICAGRLFSGTIQEGMQVTLNNANVKQRIQTVFMYNGVKPEIIQTVPAGNVLALMGISANAGETITIDPEQPFEELKHIFEPVISKSISVKKPADLPKLVEVLRKVAKEDPSVKVEINEETGENLLSGMGELHLEIIENRIKTEKGVDVLTGSPIVVYRETCLKPGNVEMGKSPNKHNHLYFKVEPMPDAIFDLIKSGKIPEMRFKKRDLEVRDQLMEVGMDTKVADKVKEIYKGNMFIDGTRGIVYINEIMEMVLDMFRDVMNYGPLGKEPCIKLIVTLDDCKLHEDAIHRGPAQMYPAIRDGIRASMMTASPVLFEPLQIMVIEAPVDYMGEISKLVSNKRGQLQEMNQEGTQVVVKAKMPVMELLGWSSDLRSATGGRGNSSILDQVFERLPTEIQPKVIQQLKQRKGLTDAMLGA